MKILGIDTESNGRDYRYDPKAVTTGVSLASSPTSGKYYPINHEIGVNLGPEGLAEVRKRIDDADILVFHNRKHDRLALKQLGIDIDHKQTYCTMLMVHFLHENLPNKSLDYVCKRFGVEGKDKSPLMEQFIKCLGWGGIPVEVMRPYAERDAEAPYELFEKLYPRFCAEGYDRHLWQREIRFSDLISRMEALGIEVDQSLCERESRKGHARMGEIRDALGLNPSSPKDLEELLINRLGLDVEKETPSGKPSFDKEAMKAYEEVLSVRKNPTAKLVLEYRGWQKSCSSNYDAYLKLLSPNGTLHPNFKLHGTKTGRLSCECPNLQQIPRSSANAWNGNLKCAFVAREGYALYEADYANLELRLAAVYSQEPNLIEPLRAGFKPFDAMSEQLGWVRQNCKTFTYATLYGGGTRRIANLFGLGMEEAKQMRESWYANFPRMHMASERASRLAERRGYVALWTGRRRHLRRDDAHKALNSLLQGGAAELVKSVMLTLTDLIDWDTCRMLLQVHDSIVFEIKSGTEGYWIPRIQTAMEDVSAYHAQFGKIPFPVEVKRWAP